MKLFSLFFMTTLLLSFASISASESRPVDCHHKCHRSKNDFIPTVRLQLTPDLCSDWFAVSFLGEAGVRNYRANGTVGFAFGSCSRFKVGGEYLTQKLNYGYSSGSKRQWVHQYALGGGYQYLLDCNFIQSLDAYGHYSHAYDKKLKTLTCRTDPLIERRIDRRIAGSNAYNVGGGVTLGPWCLTSLSLSVDYDHVKYNRKLQRRKTVKGFGGTVGLIQTLPYNLNLGFKGEFRRPYNYLEVLVGWTTCTRWGNVNIGVYGGHTCGKYDLPNSTVAGVTLNWDFDWGYGREKGSNNTCCPIETCSTCCNPCNDLARWIAFAPAVYVPEVLAISEQRTRTRALCSTPIVLGTLGPLNIPDGALPEQIPTAFLFDAQGQPITFSVTTDSPNVIATIDPVTGVITLSQLPGDMVHTLTVTASVPGGCAPASTTVQVQLIETETLIRFP